MSFLTLHILNLCTPLAPPQYNTHSVLSRKVDITGSGIRTVLTALAESVALQETGLDLAMKVAPPIYVCLFLPPPLRRPAALRRC
jgi:hydroxymethylglutaryl-CoA reductase (NADPH)